MQKFDITIPASTHDGQQVAATWPSRAHGWFIFLKHLPPDVHTLDYHVNVRGTGENPTSAVLH